MRRTLALTLTIGFAAAAIDAGATYPRVERDKIERLVQMRFPFERSQVNCHGTALLAAGIRTTLMAQDGQILLDANCFDEVAEPLPGDLGIWAYGRPATMIFHSFLVLGSNQIFEKANPGWTENPFEVVHVARTKLATHHAQYGGLGGEIALAWRRYHPRPTCALTRFNAWVDVNRASPQFGPMIRTMEAMARGETPGVDAGDFLRTAANLPRFNSEDPFEAQLAQLHREYLWIPQFKAARDELIRVHRTKLAALHQHLVASLKKGHLIELANLVAASEPVYHFWNVGTYDTAFDGYLRTGVERYQALARATAEPARVNRLLRAAGVYDVSLDEVIEPPQVPRFLIRTDQARWTLNPSSE